MEHESHHINRSGLSESAVARTPGIKRSGKKLGKQIAALYRPYVDSIGPDWEKTLKSANTCVGLPIEHFASSLGSHFRLWYGLVYSSDSQHVHQSDLTQFLDADEKSGVFSPRWFTSPDEIRTTLHKSALIYFGCICELQKRFRFGVEADKQIGKFSQGLKSWMSD